VKQPVVREVERVRMGNRTVIPPKARTWLLENFVIGTKNYWFTFIADTATAIILVGIDLLSPNPSYSSLILAFFAGYLAWGFTEYAFHRWVYHYPSSIFGEGHRIHHDKPEALLAMPWFMTTLVMAGIWWTGSRYLHIPAFGSFQAGWLIGFVWYSAVHHIHHHTRPNSPWLRRLKAYHKIHHHFPDHNYGVTMVFWDYAFRTHYRPKLSRKKSGSPPSQAQDVLLEEVGPPA